MDVQVFPEPTCAVLIPERGIAVPLGARFRVQDPALPGLEITGSVGADSAKGSVVVDEIRLHRLPDGPSIDADHLRKVSPSRIVDAVIERLAVAVDASRAPVVIDLAAAAALTGKEVTAFRRGVASLGDTLSEVAEVYNESPHKPTARVADRFGWSRTTASRRIREARDAGLIDEVSE